MTKPTARPGEGGRGDHPRRLKWLVERCRGPAARMHALGLAERPQRLVRVVEVDGPALVLGSTQDQRLADAGACASRGVDVVRRRSGGGAVLVEPGRLVWVDVVVPAGDPLWSPDVGRAFFWLGEAWARALRAAAPGPAVGGGLSVHRGRLTCSTRWGRLVCFAGVGAGEVVKGEAKVVGMAQRRTRAGALFQCALPLAWDARALADLLALPDDERRCAGAELAHAVSPLSGAGADDVVARLVAELPS